MKLTTQLDGAETRSQINLIKVKKMADEVQTKIIVLWEHELRKAAVETRKAIAAMDQYNNSETEFLDAMAVVTQCIDACHCALAGLDESHAIAMLSRADVAAMAGGDAGITPPALS